MGFPALMNSSVNTFLKESRSFQFLRACVVPIVTTAS